MQDSSRFSADFAIVTIIEIGFCHRQRLGFTKFSLVADYQAMRLSPIVVDKDSIHIQIGILDQSP
ncbi:hypothetical protein ACTWQL_22295 [Pseudalkalibacillus sp. R45]|uniref:hypothetical protein n=1 Tax=Pseudalkalibacillus sp. R45 TaxID=3457433 RepID=UPI003FCDCEDE